MKQLWLIRHPQVLIKSGTCYGQLDIPSDPASNATQAQSLAATLPDHLIIYCSPLQRCHHLAITLLALRKDLQIELDPNLQEMDFGSWEGKLWQDIPQNEIAAWTDNFLHYSPGGGESVSTFMARVNQSYRKFSTNCAWITHAGVIRASHLLHAKKFITQASDWPIDVISVGCHQTLEMGS
ncbi:histidine phosphatase family protein [Polynucleobacter sp. IMCC 29146]|uniref:histidine phosphatase family protein n=1 Tax=Polynucleobacter sp. IMCC 29146 TaxID=2780953 RepID=UPI001F485253|nr:histidine phosphatase family protein [Polynucleobacter sp. IMCC 29146]MCE7529990.1 histidine phosphatase family protein [Polynucleobacter sp. IMCC 29146]